VPENPWTEARVAALQQLIAQRLSFSQIAKRLGVSRNAAIGKANRVRITARRGPAQCALASPTGDTAAIAADGSAPRPSGRLPRPASTLRCEPIPPAVAVDPLNLPMDQLKWFHCRYITNDDLQYSTYCARRTVESTSWCAFHLGRVRAPLPVEADGSPCPAFGRAQPARRWAEA
jgi:hypothetical protein